MGVNGHRKGRLEQLVTLLPVDRGVEVHPTAAAAQTDELGHGRVMQAASNPKLSQQRAAGDIGELLRQREVTEITTPRLSAETIEHVRDLIERLEKKELLGVSNPRIKLEDFFLKDRE